MRDEKEILNRWRLALGRYSDGAVASRRESCPMRKWIRFWIFSIPENMGKIRTYERSGGEEPERRSLRCLPGSKSCVVSFRNQPQKSWSAMLWKNME